MPARERPSTRATKRAARSSPTGAASTAHALRYRLGTSMARRGSTIRRRSTVAQRLPLASRSRSVGRRPPSASADADVCETCDSCDTVQTPVRTPATKTCRFAGYLESSWGHSLSPEPGPLRRPALRACGAHRLARAVYTGRAERSAFISPKPSWWTSVPPGRGCSLYQKATSTYG